MERDAPAARISNVLRPIYGRSVMHQANADYDPEEYRYLYRIMLKGEKLEPAFD